MGKVVFRKKSISDTRVRTARKSRREVRIPKNAPDHVTERS